MIFLNGVKWKHSLKRLMQEESPDSTTPKEDKAAIRKLIKTDGVVYCAHDPFEEEINECKVLLWHHTEHGLEQLVNQASQEI